MFVFIGRPFRCVGHPILVLVVLMSVQGCGSLIKPPDEEIRQAERAADVLSPRLGVRPEVGFRLEDLEVRVTLPASATRERTVAQLEAIIAPVIAAEFTRHVSKLEIVIEVDHGGPG